MGKKRVSATWQHIGSLYNIEVLAASRFYKIVSGFPFLTMLLAASRFSVLDVLSAASHI
jgi:hypothetical protein